MVKAVNLFKSAKNIFYTSTNKSMESNPIAEISERLSGKQKIIDNMQLFPETGTFRSVVGSLWGRLKILLLGLKPKLPQNYTSEISEPAVNATLKKYLECYKPANNQTVQQFKAVIRNKLGKFYLNEAKKAEEIIKKNKTVFEELDKNYQSSLDKIAQEIMSANISKENAYKCFISEKTKVDQEFANKILDILAREYNLEEIKPMIECSDKLTGNVIGGWNAVMGKISIDSSKFTNSASLAGIMFHEYTHFRQDVETFKIFGEKEYIKYLAVKMGLRMHKENPSYVNLTVSYVLKEILTNPMYKKLKIYTKKHSGVKKGVDYNLIRMRLIENVNYKDCVNHSYDEYANQLGELHAHHNGDYFKKLYMQIFPDHAKVRRV